MIQELYKAVNDASVSIYKSSVDGED